MELPITRLERVDDQHTTTEVSGQDEIAETFLDHWRRLFNLPALAPSAETDARDILAVIRDDPARQLAPEMAARLDVAALISVGSIEAAIDAMKTDTAPGADGFPPRFYKDRRWRRRLAERLHRLYAQIVRDGEMTEAMRESVISILYKGKGKNRRRCKSYRPVSIAALERRILGKAIELQLRLAVPSVLSGSNLGFIPGERIEDDALLTAAAAAHCDASGRGGAMLYLDNVAAYDRVRIAFLIETLRAFGFPDEFTSLIETMHRGRTARLKVNGHVGQSFALNNGLTQGAPESCMLFLLVQEVLLRMIATDPMLRGVSIPGRDEGSPIELRERSFADDTKVFLETASQAPRLAATIRQYERVSGQWLDMSEAVGVLFGADKKITLPADNFGVKAWRCFGEDELERCLGVVLGSPAQVTAQWEAKVAEVEQALLDLHAGRRPARTVTGRVTLAASKLAGVFHTFRVQVPPPAARKKLTARLQKAVDGAVNTTRFHGTTKNLQMQHHQNGGQRHINVAARLDAAWTMIAVRLAVGKSAPWQGPWWDALGAAARVREAGEPRARAVDLRVPPLRRLQE